jgi:hypothetical protein
LQGNDAYFIEKQPVPLSLKFLDDWPGLKLPIKEKEKMWNRLGKWDKALFIVVILFGITQIFAYQQDAKMDALEAELNGPEADQ